MTRVSVSWWLSKCWNCNCLSTFHNIEADTDAPAYVPLRWIGWEINSGADDVDGVGANTRIRVVKALVTRAGESKGLVVQERGLLGVQIRCTLRAAEEERGAGVAVSDASLAPACTLLARAYRSREAAQAQRTERTAPLPRPPLRSPRCLLTHRTRRDRRLSSSPDLLGASLPWAGLSCIPPGTKRFILLYFFYIYLK